MNMITTTLMWCTGITTIIIGLAYWLLTRKKIVSFVFNNHNLRMTSQQKETWDALTTSQKNKIFKAIFSGNGPKEPAVLGFTGN